MKWMAAVVAPLGAVMAIAMTAEAVPERWLPGPVLACTGEDCPPPVPVEWPCTGGPKLT
jgi:hypothetical protein